MKYIDAEKLRKLLANRYEEITVPVLTDEGGLESFYRRSEIHNILKIVDSLQQERQEVDLEKDVESWFFNEISSKINIEHTMYYYFQECARRYFELGKNSE